HTAAQQNQERESPLAPPPEPVNRILLVTAGVEQGRALDRDIRFGETYEYRVQRVASVSADGQKLELAGPLSPPLRIDAVNIFPPAVPTGLAAVAAGGENGAGSAIDLSWTPDTEADLAGYIVYRREQAAAGEGAWQRISPSQPVAGPGFHDAGVQPGHTYDYAVSAIDEEGHESARSAEAQETVPEP
ncbi:MAG: fibronectin type III domain-containing protein, partial [Terracidiphilus sp.]